MAEKKTPVALSVDDDARKCFEAQDLIRIILADRNIQPRHIRAPALPKKFSQRDSAMPPDVRKRPALPSIGSMNLGLRPKTWAPPENSISNLPEGRRPSAHQTAQPYL